jgi:gas vesicle protein
MSGMNSSFEKILIGFAAFVGGVSVGLLVAPRSGRETRDQIASDTRTSTRWLENQIRQATDQLRTTKTEVISKIKTSTQETIDQILPDLAQDSDEWNTMYGDVADEAGREGL